MSNQHTGSQTATAGSAISPYEPPKSLDGTPLKLLRLKGQLHCHWFDDFDEIPWLKIKVKEKGQFNIEPGELEARYKAQGYQFIAVTEHSDRKCCTFPGNPDPLVTPTGKESDNPVFVHIVNCEEVTADTVHVLAIGVNGYIDKLDQVARHQVKDCDADTIAGLVNKQGGLSFFAHPGQYLSRSPRKVLDSMTAGTTPFSPLSGVSIRTAACHLDWIGTWDFLLANGVAVQTAPGRYIPVPAFVEDDYAPIGLKPFGRFIHPGSTWLLLDVYTNDANWPLQSASGWHETRSGAIIQSLREGRWWSYWVDNAVPWGKAPFPQLSICIDEATGIVKVDSDRDLINMDFIGARGMSRPLARMPVKAHLPVEYRYKLTDRYIRVMATYRDSAAAGGNILFIASNPIWLAPVDPTKQQFPLFLSPRMLAMAPPLAVRWPEDMRNAELRGSEKLCPQVEGGDSVLQVSVWLDDRQLALAEVTDNVWTADVDFSHIPDGAYTLRAEAIDRYGKMAEARCAVRIRSEVTAPLVTLAKDALPASKPAADVSLRGTVVSGDPAAVIIGMMLAMDEYRIGIPTVRDQRWTCTVPADQFTAGQHTLLAVATDSFGNTGTAEVTFTIT